MGNGCVGRPEDEYYDPENQWKVRNKIEVKKKFETDNGLGGTTKHHTTPGGTATGDEVWVGYYGEVITAPNGDKIYYTPTGDDDVPFGDKKYLKDLPLNMILENYGMKLYVEEYQRRFSKKPNMDIFKRGQYYNEAVVFERETSNNVLGCRRTESVQHEAMKAFQNGLNNFDNIDDLSHHQSKYDEEEKKSEVSQESEMSPEVQGSPEVEESLEVEESIEVEESPEVERLPETEISHKSFDMNYSEDKESESPDPVSAEPRFKAESLPKSSSSDEDSIEENLPQIHVVEDEEIERQNARLMDQQQVSAEEEDSEKDSIVSVEPSMDSDLYQVNDDDAGPNFGGDSRMFSKEDIIAFKSPSRENEYVVERGRQRPSNVWDKLNLGTKHGVYRHFEKSSERKPRDYSNLRLTPDNRNKKIAQFNESRDSSLDRSSIRGYGISPSHY